MQKSGEMITIVIRELKIEEKESVFRTRAAHGFRHNSPFEENSISIFLL